MRKLWVACLVLLVLSGITFSVKAEDAGSITLDFTQFIDQMEIANQLETPSYGIATMMPEKTPEFTSMNIKVVKVEDGNESTCWESNITTLENIPIDLDPGTYKVYTQVEGDDTVLEYNNDSEGYVITPQSHLVIPMAYPPWEGYILDAPWRIENSEINIPILAVDTGTDWADIYDINVYDHNDGDRSVTSTNWSSTQPIYFGEPFFHLFNINKSSFVQIDGKVSMRIKFELHWSPDNWEGPVNVKIPQYDIPTMVGWYCGDTHLHTNYTDNTVEFGAPIYATRAANNAMGLDWMIVTDHSFDLWQEKWNVSTADCNNYSDNLFRVMQGEEVSCYLPGTDIIPGAHQYNHLLVYGADFIPGGEWEDGTGSDYTPAEAIAIANSQGGVTYPAHPFYDDPFRDPWRDEDYNLPFTGLQIWNYASDEPTHLPDGLAKWSELLLGGRHVYVEGGTDAHGDFNKHAGKVKTYIYAQGYSQSSLPPRSEILNALRNGHSVMTDGPLVIFDINGEMIGNNVSLTNGTNATLRIQWNSTQEFGYINNITVKKGVINGTEETNFTIITPSSIGKDPLCDEHELIISPNESCYYRVEAYSNTTNGEQYRCYTNPIWVDVLANQLPTASFTYSPEKTFVNQTITFDASNSTGPDGTIVKYNWDFGDGNSTEGEVVTHSYSSAGTYTVNLTVTNDAGATNTTSKVVAVIPAETGNYTEIGGKIYCLVKGDLLFYFDVSFTGHCGMYSGNGKFVDAHPDNNQTGQGSFPCFRTINAVNESEIKGSRFDKSTTSCYRVNTTQAKRDAAVEWAKGEIGKNYNLCPPTPCDAGDEWYCSELVYCAYNETNITLGEIGLFGYVWPESITLDSDVQLLSPIGGFDTGSGTYPSIMGKHTGTIRPNHTVIATKLYTYPCKGTGGHTEYAEIRNATWNATATWKGYVGDWHNISFSEPFTLVANKTYNYT